MRVIRGFLVTALLLPLGGMLAGCDSLETFQFWDTKKKLPGVRQEVFPGGVPGVTQGIPPELVKGYQEPQQANVDPAAEAAQETAQKIDPKGQAKARREAEANADAESQPKPTSKPKRRKVAKARPQPSPSAAPAPQQAQAPWPAQQQQQPPAQPAQQTQSPWPTTQ
jgi:hypothetical protein